MYKYNCLNEPYCFEKYYKIENTIKYLEQKREFKAKTKNK